MFQICLTSEESAALWSWQQELLFFSGSFPHACCMQSKDTFRAADRPDLPSKIFACQNKDTPNPAELVQAVLESCF